ncbi:MAG: hypothetical protein HY791_09185 [Deltaproteobacteria bacterium]|nr:hypothetical protein [Deltaproteobacteria bacterium]
MLISPVLALLVAQAEPDTSPERTGDPSEAPDSLAVFDLRADTSFDPEWVSTLSEYFVIRLASAGFRIVPKEEVKRRLAEDRRRSYDACYDEACQIEIGKESAARRIVVSSLRRFGSQCVISSAVLDVEKMVAGRASSWTSACEEARLVRGVEKVVSALSRPKKTNPLQPSVAFAFRASGPVTESLANTLSEHLWFQLLSSGERLVARSAQVADAAHVRAQSYSTCFDASCQIEIGKSLSAAWSIAPEIIEDGQKCRVELRSRLVREAGEIDRHAESAGACTPEGLAESVKDAARALSWLSPECDNDPTSPKGLVRIASEPSAVVRFRGRVIGKTPLDNLELPAGCVVLRLENTSEGVSGERRLRVVSGKKMFYSFALTTGPSKPK